MKKKIKVLHLLQSDRFSGAENVVCQIASMLKNNDQLEMVYSSKDGPIRDSLKNKGIPFYPMSKLCLTEVRRVVKEYKPDIIHAHDASASVISALLMIKCPKISHLHSNPPWIKRHSLNSILYYLSSFRYKKILTVSESIMSEYVYGKKLEEKSLTIDNPIDTNSIKIKGNLIDPTEEEYDVAFLGRLASPKNPIKFINLINKLKSNFPNISAMMIGDGELKIECEKHIKKMELENNIKLIGFLENPYPLLSKAKILCITSIWEGFGLAAIEALSLRIPVVCTAVGGLPNIVNDNCGKLCVSDEDFVIEIEKLLTNGDYWYKKAEYSKLQADFLNNIDIYRNKIIKVYNTLGENR